MSAQPSLELLDLAPLLDANELNDQPRSEEAPRMALDLIDDSPTQPRQDYDPVTLQELADSIKAAGDVLQPVSLRPNPDAPGRYFLNFGHRRVRAARLAGLPDVPYFIGQQCDSFAQVIENEQRDNLRPLELAAFIRDRMAAGLSQQEIAQRLGKSKTAISTAATLADAPPVVVEALRSRKVDGVSPAYELIKLHAVYPEAVEQWVRAQESISRTDVAGLRRRLEAPATPAAPVVAVTDPAPANLAVEPTPPVPDVAPKPADKPAKATAVGQTAKPAPAARVLMATYKGQPLVLDRVAEPPQEGHVYGYRPGSTRRMTVPAAEVRLVGFADA